MIGPDKQHWFPIVLQKSVPYEYPATSTHAHRPLRRLLPPIFVKRPAAWTSAGEIEHYLTITPCYHLTILATAGLQTQPVMSLHFPLSRCWSWKYFLGGIWIIHFFPWQHNHSLLKTTLFTMSPLAELSSASWLSSSSSFWLSCVGQMGLRLTAPYWVCPPLAQMVATPPTNAPISPFSTIFLQPYIFILVVRCVFGCAFQKKL